MAEHLKSKFHGLALFVLWTGTCISAGAAAERLQDPTRPPAALSATRNQSDAPVVEPELQSVLISPKRRIAVISGQLVQVGDKLGEGRVVRITESEVVIRTGHASRVLRLFPQVEKQTARVRAATPVGAGSK